MPEVSQEKKNNWRKDWNTANPDYYRLHRRKKVLNGICRFCKNPKLSTATMCEEHWFKNVALRRLKKTSLWEELREKLKSQDYRCPYSGEILVIGSNTSLDHILPVSKFPELASEVSNVEWVTNNVNTAKRDMTREEFLKFCELIVETTNGST